MQNGGAGSGIKGHTTPKEETEKDIFRKSFDEYKGKPEKAIDKLLNSKTGFVPSAITRDEIGDIDFVYGEAGIKGYGIAHIIERHGEEILKEIPNIIKNGDIDFRHQKFGRLYINSKNKQVVIRLDYNGEKRNWLLTGYELEE